MKTRSGTRVTDDEADTVVCFDTHFCVSGQRHRYEDVMSVDREDNVFTLAESNFYATDAEVQELVMQVMRYRGVDPELVSEFARPCLILIDPITSRKITVRAVERIVKHEDGLYLVTWSGTWGCSPGSALYSKENATAIAQGVAAFTIAGYWS